MAQRAQGLLSLRDADVELVQRYSAGHGDANARTRGRKGGRGSGRGVA